MSEGNNSELITNLTKQLNIARSEINNLRQQLKALNNSNRKEYDEIKHTLESWQCSTCRTQEPCRDVAGPSSEVERFVHLPYIGIISTHFPEKRGTPRQPGICASTVAKLTLSSDVFTNPGHALEGLEEYSHMWIMFHFHKNEVSHTRAKVSPPRLNGIKTGVFSTRSPHRPCPIGLSLVKIYRISGNTIYFSGVDMVDETPVFDIKPFIPQYDTPNPENTEHSADSSHTFETSRTSESETGNSYVRGMDGEESVPEDTQRSLRDSFQPRPDSRIGEREAPDGEEEEGLQTTSQSSVRVPPWIDRPVVGPLSVAFKDRALSQLRELGEEGEEKKTIIANVLREDPRSVYLRERWGSHCYVFRIAELFVSCKFNRTNNSVTVYQVFQNSASESVEEE